MQYRVDRDFELGGGKGGVDSRRNDPVGHSFLQFKAAKVVCRIKLVGGCSLRKEGPEGISACPVD